MTVTGSDIDDASAVASSTECAACEFIVGEIEKLLAKNSSEMAVRWLCALVDCGGGWLLCFCFGFGFGFFGVSEADQAFVGPFNHRTYPASFSPAHPFTHPFSHSLDHFGA